MKFLLAVLIVFSMTKLTSGQGHDSSVSVLPAPVAARPAELLFVNGDIYTGILHTKPDCSSSIHPDCAPPMWSARMTPRQGRRHAPPQPSAHTTLTARPPL